MNKHRHAVQLLQYHVPPDSLRLARMLLDCEREHDGADPTTRQALVQASMDMMMRLRAYHDLVVELLKRHRLMTAMRVVLRHRERFAMETARTRNFVEEGGRGDGGGDGGGGGGGSGGASSLSTMEQGVPKEQFFRTAVSLLRETASRREEEENERAGRVRRENEEETRVMGHEMETRGGGGDGGSRQNSHSGKRSGGKLETFHAVYAFYRELWPHLLQPILKEASSTSTNDDPISPLAASTSFPDDLFDDFRVADMYRSLFGFNHSGRE